MSTGQRARAGWERGSWRQQHRLACFYFSGPRDFTKKKILMNYMVIVKYLHKIKTTQSLPSPHNEDSRGCRHSIGALVAVLGEEGTHHSIFQMSPRLVSIKRTVQVHTVDSVFPDSSAALTSPVPTHSL